MSQHTRNFEPRRGLLITSVPVALALGLSIALRMGTSVLSTRLSPLADYGNFATVNAIGAFAGAIAMGGWPSFLLAVVPKQGLSRRLVRHMSLRLVFTCAGLIVAQTSFILFSLHGRWNLSILAFAAMLMTATVFGTTFNEAQRASGNILRSRFAIAIIPPVATTIGLVVDFGSRGPLSTSSLLLWNAFGWFVLWAWASFWLRRVYQPDPADTLQVSRRDLMLTKISQAALSTADVFVVGWLLGPTQGALYAIASRVAVTAGIGYTAVVMAFGPNISRLAGNGSALSKLSRRMTIAGAIFTVPITVGIGLVAHPVLQLFGSEYTDGATLLRILLAGVAANAIAGPIGLIVNVTGQERIGRRTLLAAAAVFISLLAPAALFTGAIGVAALWVTITISWNVALWLQVDVSSTPKTRTVENP